MDESLIFGFEQLQISAQNKLNKLNRNCLNSVTIGPNCCKKIEKEISLPQSSKKKGISKDTRGESNQNSQNNQLLEKYENLRKQNVQSAIQDHMRRYEEFSKKQETHKKQKWLEIHESFIKDVKQKESFIFQAMDEYDQNTSNDHAKLAQHYKALDERRRIHRQEVEQRERQNQVMIACIDKIIKNQHEFRLVYQQIIPTLKKCSSTQELKSLAESDLNLLKVLCESIEEAVTKCKTSKVSEADVTKTSDVVMQMNHLNTRLIETVNKINAKNEEAKTISAPKPVRVSTSQPVEENNIDVEKTQNLSVSIITRYISLKNLKIYTDLMDFLNEHRASFKNLEDDVSQKQFRFDCKKAINIPVNSLSGVNSEHILDKYNRLHKLLKGQDVIVSDKKINASKHPQGIAFCTDLLAKKFVLQGDLMVSSNPEAAFCYASVIISLWNEFFVFGKLVLAYFYQYCPYLVPNHVPRQIGESDEEFYMRQGYQFIDGQIEKQDKFLKRMTGIMRLYAAILIVKPKRGQNINPHNIQHGWRWLSSILKLEPLVDITATMLHVFLESVGFEMEARYGRTFQKLIKIIVEKFLPSCRMQCTGGAVTRLELLLTAYFKTGKFEPPSGYIGYNNW